MPVQTLFKPHLLGEKTLVTYLFNLSEVSVMAYHVGRSGPYEVDNQY